MFVNCQPARPLCWPVIAPAQAIVRAGNGGGKCGIRNAELGARGDERIRHCGSVAALCSRFMSSFAVLSRRFASAHVRRYGSVGALALGAYPALRFCRGALPRFTPAVCRMATNRTACDILRSYSAGRDRHLCVLEMFFGYLTLWVHFGFVRFFMAISTGCQGRGGRRTENGAGGAALVRFCAIALALQFFPRGVRWGCAPQTAPKSLRLSGLSSRCGGVVLVRIRCAVARVHG